MPGSGNNLWFTTGNGSVLVTTNAGTNFTSRATGVPSLTDITFRNSTTGIAVGGSFVLEATSQIVITTNSGQDWFPAMNINGSILTAAHFLPQNPNIVFAAGGSNMFKSTNGGLNWTQVNVNFLMDFTASITSVTSGPNTKLFAFGGNFVPPFETKVFVSTDMGATWNQITAGFALNDYITAAYVIPGTSTIIAATGDGSLYRSTNGGDNFSPMTVNPPIQIGSSFEAITGDGLGNVYVAGLDGSVYKMPAGSNTATPTTFQPPANNGINTIVKGSSDGDNPLIDNSYYVGCGNGAIYKTSNGGGTTGISSLGNPVVNSFELYQNYPNPFNPSTTINYNLIKNGYVIIKVYNSSGQEVSTLTNQFHKAGYYSVSFNASGLSSGVYFYKIFIDGFSETKSMVLIK
ncbi:MAG TPA: T9SS type A sorting domain-containing protein [Ignavibacteria bacterium]|nr:T9SS type A sorting domain-containing protein [Ignavibacteria bacterium]